MADERGEGSLRMRWRREALRARDLDFMDQSPIPESSFDCTNLSWETFAFPDQSMLLQIRVKVLKKLGGGDRMYS